MSVSLIHVTLMQAAITPMVALPVPVLMVMMEMDFSAMVGSLLLFSMRYDTTMFLFQILMSVHWT